MSDKYCLYCMNPSETDVCPGCGKNSSRYAPPPHTLPPGTVLAGKYLLGAVLGEGGFGITYIARDINLNLRVAVKEYFPKSDVTRSISASLDVTPGTGKAAERFEKGKQQFLKEVRTLSLFTDETNIVNVRDFFTENNTSYIVTSFVPGVNLNDYIAANGKMSYERVFELLSPIMKALGKIHAQGLIHRDISPANIMLTSDGVAKLIDFGTTREFTADSDATYSVVLKVGYSPEEQYRSSGRQGPQTDIYSLSATAYYLLTGKVPVDSISRLFSDDIESITALNGSVTKEQEEAVMKGMAVSQKDRYATMDEMCAAFASCLSPAQHSAAAAPVPAPKQEAAPSPSPVLEPPKAAVQSAPQPAVTPVQPPQQPLSLRKEEIAQAPPSKLGLFGSIVCGVISLLLFPVSVSALFDNSSEAPSKPFCLGLLAVSLVFAVGMVFAGRTYFPRTKDRKSKPKAVFPVFSVLFLLVSVFLLIQMTLSKDVTSRPFGLSVSLESALAAVFFSWLFYRRLQPSGRKLFKKIASGAAVISVLGVVGFMAFHGLNTVMIGDQQINLNEQSVSLYGDLITNRDMERLKKLKNLTYLRLSGCFLDDEDVGYLSELTSLESLYIDYNTDITDVSRLTSLKNLKDLSISETSVTDISALTSLSELETLDISNTKVHDLSCLSSFGSLTEAEINSIEELDPQTITVPSTMKYFRAKGVGLTTLDFLKPAGENLYYLDASENEITDISALSGFTRLSTVDLCSNQVSDISALKELDLSSLDITNNSVSDISPLANKERLSDFHASFNDISDISPLAGAKSLGILELSNNKIKDITPLTDRFKISILDLSCNEITDISPLATIDNLSQLDLKRNHIKDISPLASCTKLLEQTGRSFDLSCNEITDISPLSGAQCNSINLSHNKISDISPLAECAELKYAYLGYNEISDASALTKCSALQRVNLNFNRLTDITRLFDISGIQDIWAAENDIRDISGIIALDGTLTQKVHLSLTYRDSFDMEALKSCENISAALYDADDRTQDKYFFSFNFHTKEELAAEDELELLKDTTYDADSLLDSDSESDTGTETDETDSESTSDTNQSGDETDEAA